MPTEEPLTQSFEAILPEEEKAKEEKYITLGRLKIKLKIVLIGVGVFFGLLLTLIILAANQEEPIITRPKPLPTLTPTPIEERPRRPSAYATDSAILAIEAELEVLEEKIQNTDIKEATLNPPVLDMDVNFKE